MLCAVARVLFVLVSTMVGRSSSAMKLRFETPFDPNARKAPTPYGASVVMRNRLSPSSSHWAGKLVHSCVASERSVPDKVISVAVPGRTASGEMESMSGAAVKGGGPASNTASRNADRRVRAFMTFQVYRPIQFTRTRRSALHRLRHH